MNNAAIIFTDDESAMVPKFRLLGIPSIPTADRIFVELLSSAVTR